MLPMVARAHCELLMTDAFDKVSRVPCHESDSTHAYDIQLANSNNHKYLVFPGQLYIAVVVAFGTMDREQYVGAL
jgi:hypothetical protein